MTAKEEELGAEFLLLGLLGEPGGIGHGPSLQGAREAITALLASRGLPHPDSLAQPGRPSRDPIDYVRPGFPPAILLHGVADRMPVENSVALFNALRGAEAPVELHLLEGVTHIFDKHAEFADASADLVDLFLDRHVANPRSYPSTEPPPILLDPSGH